MKAGQPSIFDPPEPKLNRSTLARGGWNQGFPLDALDVLEASDRDLTRLILRSP
jgi:hypothetical protein